MSDAPELFDFVDEYLRDRSAGREEPLSHYLRRYPGHEDAIAREFLGLRSRVEPQSTNEAERARDDRRVGSYRLIAELGRGGQGTVWMAEDTRIARKVALKLLPGFFNALSAERRQRFQREAEIVSRLAHPALATIYEADIAGETPFIAMRCVEGDTLAALVERARRGESSASLALPPRTPLEFASVLGFFERAARALHAAHEAGVVHRDVKPANLMVDPNGEPVVLDFGLAREETSSGAALTMTGEVFGTPAFMSPEQIEGSSHALDRRSDVWSLGASLYEALTLERPFAGESVAELLRAIRERPLGDPRVKNRGVSRELAIVIETALEKDRERRYASALELAEDLRRVREYEPIQARPASAWLKLRRWSQRHPALATSLGALIVVLAGGLIWTSYMLAREERALQFALGRHLAERAIDLIAEDPSESLVLGIQAVERAPNDQTRAALFTALDACRLDRTLDRGTARRMLDLRSSHDATRALAALDNGIASVYDLASGAAILDTPRHPGEVARVRWLAKDASFATASIDGVVRVFDSKSGALVRELRLDSGEVRDLDADRDGERILALSSDGSLAVWSSSTGDRVAFVAGAANGATRACLAPHGDFAACWCADDRANGAKNEIVLVNVARAEVAARLNGHSSGIRSVAFRADGGALVSASADFTARLWSVPSGAPIGSPLVHLGALCSARFSPDGKLLAVALEDGPGAHAKLWDLACGVAVDLAGHEGSRVSELDFSPDGTKVASASHDLSVRIWSTKDASELAVGRSFLQPLSVHWTGDGRRVVALDNASAAHVWFGGNRPDVYELRGHADALTSASFSFDGERALTTSEDGTARVWSTPSTSSASESGAQLSEFRGHRAAVRGGELARAGDFAMTWSDDGSVRFWRASNAEPIASVELGAPVRRAELARDASRFVAIAIDGRALLGEVRDPSAARELGRDVRCAHFTADGAHVVTGHAANAIRVWNAKDGTREFEHAFQSADAAKPGVVEIALREDGSEIAAGCEDLRVRFFALSADGETRKPLMLFRMQSLAYDLGGTRIFATGPKGRGAVKLFDLETGAILHPEVYHTANLTGGAFSSDGRFFVTTSEDATAYVREALDGTPFVHLRGHRAAVVSALFSPPGGPLRLITASRDGTARVSPIDPLPSARARRPRELSDTEFAREQRLALPLRYP